MTQCTWKDMAESLIIGATRAAAERECNFHHLEHVWTVECKIFPCFSKELFLQQRIQGFSANNA